MSVITAVGDARALYRQIADAVSEYFKLAGGAEVEVITLSREEIRELNVRSRGVDRATDVLSFPCLNLTAGRYKPFDGRSFAFDVDPDTGRVCLGSIAICDSVAEEQAAEYGHSAEREKGYLFLHGLLHLLGYDHIDDGDRALMREAEEAILNGIGLKRI